MNIGQQIQDLREKKNMKQGVLAKLIGISSASMSAIENGKNKPTYENLIAISNIFEVSIDFLLTGKKQIDTLTEEEQQILEMIREDKELKTSIVAALNFKKKVIDYLSSYIHQGDTHAHA